MSGSNGITPKDRVFEPGPGRIFVFGSNTRGVHGRGAALTAVKLYGAKYGQGEGLQGQSYAIPTKDAKLLPLSLPLIYEHVKTFLEFADMHPELTFFVTRVGCGLAGKTDAEISPFFYGAPENVELPTGWGR
jgi:hypothetical protein